MIINEGELADWALETVPKLWGMEFIVVNNEHYCCKYLKINPGFVSSIHKHKLKDETFVCISGTLLLALHYSNGDVEEVIGLDSGKMYRIAPGHFHSFRSYNVAWVLEVSTHHSEDDVVRLTESRRDEPPRTRAAGKGLK